MPAVSQREKGDPHRQTLTSDSHLRRTFGAPLPPGSVISMWSAGNPKETPTLAPQNFKATGKGQWQIIT